ncbi:MAG TPA: LuxR C-terminal-related transcriptional regulator [Thermoanaerobaculia bacterium]|nr:LuxR C-terminal-related transcriptional regulator [Thermoanaerobaculia bacterium]
MGGLEGLSPHAPTGTVPELQGDGVHRRRLICNITAVAWAAWQQVRHRRCGVVDAHATNRSKMIRGGLRDTEIAARLEITEGTVKFHLHSIYEKLRIDGRYEPMSYARDHGLE